MKRCPITYEVISEENLYSEKGLKLLHRDLKSLEPLKYTAEEQREQALERTGKMSVQGVQLKLSAVLRVQQGKLEVVDRNGRFILKPPSVDFPELPQNEDLTMRLAAAAQIEVPQHGLIYARDMSLTYFTRRFDRAGWKRIPLEDFAQLSGATRETKYESSMEKVTAIINDFCTFPAIERKKLFQRTLFSFLTGNEDMHLKNFSLITRENGRIDLSPAYDLVNSTIVLKKAKEEMALPIKGKRASLTRSDLFDYFAKDRLQLNDRVLSDIINQFNVAFDMWDKIVEVSFLSKRASTAYTALIKERRDRLNLL